MKMRETSRAQDKKPVDNNNARQNILNRSFLRCTVYPVPRYEDMRCFKNLEAGKRSLEEDNVGTNAKLSEPKKRNQADNLKQY